MPSASSDRGPKDRDAREARLLELAIVVGVVGFFLMLARVAAGGDPLVLGLFAGVFFVLSGAAFAALRFRVWRAWSHKPIPRRRAMVVIGLVGAGSIVLYAWALLGGVATSSPFAWWESLTIVLVGSVVLVMACIAGYKNLVRQGVII